MMLARQNHIIIGLTIIVNIFLCLSPANGQTKQDFYNLLPAYDKARFRYGLASADLEITQEDVYWLEQYTFYRQKLENIINKYDQAARNNPQAYCLDALELYDRYNKVNSSSTVILDSSDSSMLYFELFMNLQTYCGRFDIYYNPTPRM